MADFRISIGSTVDQGELNQSIQTVRQRMEDLNRTSAQVDLRINQRALRSTLSELTDFNERVRRSVEGIGRSFARIARFQLITRTFSLLNEEVEKSIQLIIDLDKVLTSIGVVTGKTNEELTELGITFNRLAVELGTTTVEVAKASEIFFRQGKDTAEVLELVEATTIAASLANTDMTQTSEFLTATLNGFNIEATEAISIVDKFSAVAASAGTSFEEVSFALTKVASGAAQAGLDIDFMIAAIATVSEVTREAAENIGTSFKTIIARMTKLTKESGGMTGELNNVEKALKSIDVELRDESTGLFRDLQDVLSEVGERWDTLNRNQKAYIATALAGTRQQNRLIALFANWDRALEILEISQDSAGTSAIQFQQHLNGIEAAMARLRAAMEAIALGVVSSDFIKFMVNATTETLKNVEAIGGLSVVLIGIVPLFAKWISIIKKAIVAEGTLIAVTQSATIASFGQQLITASKALLGFSVAAEGAAVSVGVLNVAAFGLIAVVGLVIAAFIKWRGEAKRTQEILEETLESIKIEEDQLESIDKLVDRLEELEEKTKKTKKETEELLELQRQIAELLPETADAFDENGKAISTNTELTKMFIEEQKELLKLEAFDAAEALDVRGAERAGLRLESEIANLERLRQEGERLARGEQVVRREIGPTGYGQVEIVTQQQLRQEMKQSLKVIQEQRQEVIDFNTTRERLNEITGESEELINVETDAYIQNLFFRKEVNEEAENQLTLEEELIKVNDERIQSMENLNSAMDQSQARQRGLIGVLKELDDAGKISVDSLQLLIETQPQLIAHLGDQATLREQLIGLIEEEGDTQRVVLRNMLAQSQEFFNAKIKGQNTVVNELAELYEVDLENVADLEGAKVLITGKVVSRMGGIWTKYFETTSEGLVAVNEDMLRQQLQLLKIFGGVGEFIINQVMKAVRESANRVNNEIKRVRAEFDAVVDDLIKVDFSGIDFTPIGDNAEDTAKKVKNSYRDAFRAIESLQSKLVKALRKKYEEDRDNALAVVKAKRDAELFFRQTELAQIQRDIDALQDERRLNEFDILELRRQRDAWAKDTSVFGKAKVAELDRIIFDQSREFNKQQLEDRRAFADQRADITENIAELERTLATLTAIDKPTEEQIEQIDMLNDAINGQKETLTDLEDADKQAFDERIENLKKLEKETLAIIATEKDEARLLEARRRLLIIQQDIQEEMLEDQKLAIEKSIQDREEAFKKEEEQIEKNFEEKTSEQALFNEITKMLLARDEEGILALLETYAPEYNDVGRLLGKSMTDGMLEEIRKAFDALKILQDAGLDAIEDADKEVPTKPTTPKPKPPTKPPTTGGGGRPSATVLDIQRKLNSLGENLAEDGIMGPKTRAAILRFQRKHPDLANDGIAGPKTLAKMNEVINRRPIQGPKPFDPTQPIIPAPEGGRPPGVQGPLLPGGEFFRKDVKESKSLINKVGDFLKGLVGFQTGGLVRGTGLAQVEDKELVLNEEDTANVLRAVKIASGKTAQGLTGLALGGTAGIGQGATVNKSFVVSEGAIKNEIQIVNNTPFDVENNMDNLSKLMRKELDSVGFRTNFSK